MTRLQKIIAFALAAGVLLVGGASIALANPSYFAAGVSTNNTASSTPAYLTPGAATSTTPTYDAYAPTTGTQHWAANSAGLLQQFCASSTATVLKTSIEFSADGIDWYANFVQDPSQTGTTSLTRVLGASPFSFSQTFASTSLKGAAVASTNNCSTVATTIPTPFRYIRVVQSMTGGNGSIWDQLVPIKEQQ